jgi:hypothetical protein
MTDIENIGECEIGEVNLDPEQRLIYVRLYNVTIAFEYEEWNDFVAMMHNMRPIEEEGLPIVVGNWRCPSCGFESRASAPTGYTPPCPNCNAEMESMGEDDIH